MYFALLFLKRGGASEQFAVLPVFLSEAVGDDDGHRFGLGRRFGGEETEPVAHGETPGDALAALGKFVFQILRPSQNAAVFCYLNAVVL